MPAVSELWRYPIKSHGRQQLETVELIAGQTMPWDRHWAVTHASCKFDPENPAWVMCRNFMIGASTPSLAGLWAEFDDTTQTLTLTHANCDPITFRPDDVGDAARFIEWITPLCPTDGRLPTGVVSAGTRGMTDTDYPTVSLLNVASHDAVAEHLQLPLEQERWRGNIWISGLPAWGEFDLVGQDVKIGAAVLHVEEPIERCMATAANPRSGLRDVDTLKALRDGWGHQNFGVYATVKTGGQIATNDSLEVL